MKIIIDSKYIKPGENIEAGDIVKIKDEGKYNPGKYGPQLELKLELPDGRVKSYTPNTQTQINLKQEFGDDSKNWIDQPLKAWVYEKVEKGEVKMQLILSPADWEEVVKTAKTNKPKSIFAPASEDDVDVKDIPFGN